MTMKKYNIALIPKCRVDAFVSLVEKERFYTHGYCIGKDSIPHITICQFFFDAAFIKNIWHNICSWMNGSIVNLSFSQYSHLTFDGNIYWISLIPDDVGILLGFFQVVSEYVVSIREDQYDPHLTLFNYSKKNSNFIQKTLGKKIFIEDQFELVMGSCDEFGQLKKVLFFND
jgi:hypothetical protein